MSGITRRVFGVAGLILLATFLWWSTQSFLSPSLTTITTDLAPFNTVGEAVKSDFTTHPLVSIGEDYAITDTLKDGVDITYGATPAPIASTTLTSPDTKESLTLQFPPTLQEPLTITLPNNRSFTVTHNIEGAYQRELLTGDIPAPRTVLGGEEDEGALSPEPTYLKYTSPDTRLTTYYAYQKDQAAGYRNLKHWTIFASGTGEESQSYVFHNAHLRTNDRGEVEVRYIAPLDESKKADVGDDVWARAQAVLQADLEASIEDTPPDLTIPPPYTIDANGTKVTHEWSVTAQKDYDPGDTSGAYRLSVSFEVPLLGYPIALDPTLQFTAPGVSNAGDYLTGEAASNQFGASLTTGDFNNDGKDDLAVGAYEYNSNQGRVYIFHSGTIATEQATGADVIITGGASSRFGIALVAGDFNADSRTDLVVGATLGASAGQAYVFWNDGSFPVTAATADATITGTCMNCTFGWAFTSGDFNSDGKIDLVASASELYGASPIGTVYIFYNGNIVTETTSGADITITGNAAGDYFGYALTSGDMNADGKTDLVVSAYGYSSLTGRSYIFYNDGSIPTTAATADVTITGEDYFGSSFVVGDFNADGKMDLVVGAQHFNFYNGRAYIFYNDGSIPTTTAAADVTITGDGNASFGTSLTSGDFNADGRTDLAVGGHQFYGSGIGKGYIFYNDGSIPTTAATADVILTGEMTNNYFGSALTSGDFNQDGKDDLVVGATGYNSLQGRAYIFYSQSGQVNLDTHITGEGTSDYFGSAFTTGDWNADGKADLAVGAYLDNTNTGKVYIFYNDGSYPTGAASADVVLTGSSTGHYFGFSLASGDYNADGIDDLVVGGYRYNTSQGRAYIFYGGSMITKNASAADVILTGEATANYFGTSFVTGDFNQDGKDDLAVGARQYNSFQGRTYLFYGGSMTSENASGADVTLTGEATFNSFGTYLTTGDWNADGKADLAVGAWGYNTSQGRTYLFYGGSMSSENASGADVTLTGETTNNYFGASLTTGDLNQDGKDDLAVGAYGYNSSQGRAYIFYGGSMLSENATSSDVTLTGEASSNTFGYSLTTGDFNADGKDDLAVGAYEYNSSQGRTYLFLNDGSYSAGAGNADIIMAGNSSGGDEFGSGLATFDYNADGRDDLVVGAPGYSAGGYTGRLYFYETRENYAWDIQRQSLSDGIRVDPLMGYEMKITGETTNNQFGTSIATGDFNHDGKDDLAVGASGYNSSQGRVYIFYNDGSYGTKAGRADVTLTGETTNNQFGAFLTTGDFNADGTDDLAVGATAYNSYQGRTYLFYGGSMTSENASGADVTLTGEAASNNFGYFLITGDFNADGKDDLAVGVYGYNASTGRTYIFYGGSMISENASGADVILTGETTLNFFGTSLTTGDWNADGKDDLAVGAYRYNSGQGRAYLFYGGSMVSENATSSDITLTGEATSNQLGTALTTGDWNADGKDDLAVGANRYNSYQGRAYLFYGGSMVSENATSSDITLTGEATSNQLGTALTTGDWNADGIDDLAVSAVAYNSSQGRTYLFYGGSMTSENASGADMTLTGEATSNYFGYSLTTSDWNADGKDDLAVGATGYNSSQGRLYFYTTNDYQLTGAAAGDNLGSALAVGDFNQDGKNDLAVGATGYNSSQGRTYIFYGGSLISENASGADVILTGEATGDLFASSFITGDFNADGKDDLAIGSYGYNSSQGRTYLFYGGSMTSENATGADATLTGEATNYYFGNSLATGDWNQDGKDDLAVGSYRYNSNQGRTYLFYGGSIITENASGADITLTGEAASNYFGASLTTSDYNQDGKDDLVVGAFGYNSNQGRTYLFYGGSIITENASGADITLTGEAASNYFGASLTTGDYNTDGKNDLVVGAFGYNSSQGRTYLFYGGSMVSENATGADVILTGEATGNWFSYSSLTTGDFNHDGTDDLAVGAYKYNSDQGRTYLFYGKDLSTVSAVYADVIVTGQSTNSSFGSSLLAADLSSNGVDDLIIGASSYDVSGTNGEGRVYIISSEAATEQLSSHRFEGTIQFFGTGTFH